MFWHPQGDYLAVKVDRYTKTRKSTYTSFELFSVKLRDIPMEARAPLRKSTYMITCHPCSLGAADSVTLRVRLLGALCQSALNRVLKGLHIPHAVFYGKQVVGGTGWSRLQRED